MKIIMEIVFKPLKIYASGKMKGLQRKMTLGGIQNKSRTIPLVGGGITRHFFQTLVAPCSSVAPGPTNLNHVQNE